MTRDRVGVRRSLGLLLVGAALASACTDDGGEQAGDTTTTVEASTTTESVPETTTTETVPFDIEVRRAAIELLEIRNDVFMHPDLTRVSDYIADSCVCLEREHAFIESLAAEGQRWAQPPLVPLGAVVSRSDETEPGLTVVARQPAGQVVDSSGAVAIQVQEVELAPVAVTLVRVGAQWRLNLVQPIELERAAAEAIVAEGLP